MIIYRFTGLSEYFKGCGMMHIDPVADSNKTKLLKHANQYVKHLTDANKGFDLGVQKLHVRSMDQELAVKLFSTEDVEELVEKREWIKRWEYQHDPSIKEDKGDEL